MRMSTLLVLAIPLAAQQPPPAANAEELLIHVRDRVMRTVNRLPHYMCTETIDRSTYRPEIAVATDSCSDLASLRTGKKWKLSEYTSDRLRLDVAVSDTREVYSWAGAARFHDGALSDLVQGGASSTGTFATFLNAIFGTGAATFTYSRDVNESDRALVEFGYRVPVEQSDYRIGDALYSAIVAYDGFFVVDPKTFELVRLTVRANQLPPALHACEDVTTLEYGSLAIRGSDFLLPKEVRLHVTNNNGTELENRTVFSGCHEFIGQSSINFDGVNPPEPASVQTRTQNAVAVPAGLSFTISLTRGIDTATAAAGDLFYAQMATPVKDHNTVLIPKGAAVSGRIMQLKRVYEPQFESLTIALKVQTVTLDGAAQPFAASLEAGIRKHQERTDSAMAGRHLGSFRPRLNPERLESGTLVFEAVSRNYVITRGLEINGTTGSAAAASQSTGNPKHQ